MRKLIKKERKAIKKWRTARIKEGACFNCKYTLYDGCEFCPGQPAKAKVKAIRNYNKYHIACELGFLTEIEEKEVEITLGPTYRLIYEV